MKIAIAIAFFSLALSYASAANGFLLRCVRTKLLSRTWSPIKHVAVAVAAIAPLVVSGRASANAMYDFVQPGTGDTLSTLNLASLPATETEVLSLTFTPAGNAIFGFGVGTYTGVFNSHDHLVVDDGVGGLMSDAGAFSASLTDLDTPPSTLFPPTFVAGSSLLTLTFRASSDQIDLHYTYVDPGLGSVIAGPIMGGDWLCAQFQSQI